MRVWCVIIAVAMSLLLTVGMWALSSLVVRNAVQCYLDQVVLLVTEVRGEHGHRYCLLKTQHDYRLARITCPCAYSKTTDEWLSSHDLLHLSFTLSHQFS